MCKNYTAVSFSHEKSKLKKKKKKVYSAENESKASTTEKSVYKTILFGLLSLYHFPTCCLCDHSM